MQRQIKRFRGERNRSIHRWTDRYRQTDILYRERRILMEYPPTKPYSAVVVYRSTIPCLCDHH